MKPLLRLLNPLSTRNESIMQHEYERYSAEDFEVWQLLYIREVQQLQKSASATYFEGLKTINFRADEIPRFKKVNEKLQDIDHMHEDIVSEDNQFHFLKPFVLQFIQACDCVT